MLKTRLKLRNSVAIAACIAVTLVFASCNKDDTPKEDVFLLEEILWLASDGIGSHVFEYDSHERIIKYSYRYKDLQVYDSSLNYNADGDLVEVNLKGFNGFSLLFDKTITFIKRDNIIYTNYGKIELNEQGLPIKYTRSSQEETLI